MISDISTLTDELIEKVASIKRVNSSEIKDETKSTEKNSSFKCDLAELLRKTANEIKFIKEDKLSYTDIENYINRITNEAK